MLFGLLDRAAAAGLRAEARASPSVVPFHLHPLALHRLHRLLLIGQLHGSTIAVLKDYTAQVALAAEDGCAELRHAATQHHRLNHTAVGQVVHPRPTQQGVDGTVAGGGLYQVLIDGAEPAVGGQHALLAVQQLVALVVQHQVLEFLLVVVVELHGAEALILAAVAHHRPGEDAEATVGRREYRHRVRQVPMPALRTILLEGFAELPHRLFRSQVALIVRRRRRHTLEEHLQPVLMLRHTHLVLPRSHTAEQHQRRHQKTFYIIHVFSNAPSSVLLQGHPKNYQLFLT